MHKKLHLPAATLILCLNNFAYADSVDMFFCTLSSVREFDYKTNTYRAFNCAGADRDTVECLASDYPKAEAVASETTYRVKREGRPRPNGRLPWIEEGEISRSSGAYKFSVYSRRPNGTYDLPPMSTGEGTCELGKAPRKF
ncbi:hypothetical protein NA29_14305 [Pandoraea sputorum]|uniref:Uncharacterized protein n=1 Tax=Pandoraea sputorum TaxID=93222 RepID=A0A239SII2_9BURK|nr:hypothetical protein NA29_14305 [Pandoraea sputorum]SNU84483.1 Uncharacterised protein [Pandoraea sputorum]